MHRLIILTLRTTVPAPHAVNRIRSGNHQLRHPADHHHIIQGKCKKKSKVTGARVQNLGTASSF